MSDTRRVLLVVNGEQEQYDCAVRLKQNVIEKQQQNANGRPWQVPEMRVRRYLFSHRMQIMRIVGGAGS